MRSKILAFSIFLTATMFVAASFIRVRGVVASQQPAAGVAPQVLAPAASNTKNPATLAQLMRGTLFVDSNVIFAAQGKNPANVPAAKNPSAATNPLESTYGGWQAVQNASLAIVETATLLTVPGRVCSNGRPVPMNNPDWPKLVQGLRNAGMQSYAAAQAKSQDKILDATDVLTTACSNCHTKYRDKANLADRCQ